jgi:hypothetical protein
VRFTAITAGLYLYWAAANADDLKLRNDIDAELTGAIVVDPPGASAKDEIFVMEMISEIPGASARTVPHRKRFSWRRPVRGRTVQVSLVLRQVRL